MKYVIASQVGTSTLQQKYVKNATINALYVAVAAITVGHVRILPKELVIHLVHVCQGIGTTGMRLVKTVFICVRLVTMGLVAVVVRPPPLLGWG